jgi:protein transport protein SEC31
MVAAALAGEQSEPRIRKALVVGNFAAAVDCCLEAGLMAEALLLAQCGDQALWQKTQSAFFDRQKQKYPFLSILYAIIRSEMMNLVLQSDLSKWRETLALLSTYGKSDEFPAMCEALAGRLESERRDLESATLCYMCAANVPRVVAFWTAELKQANASLGRHTDTRALQRYVEKVTVFTQANPVNDLGADCSKYFAEYASLLASQGRLDLAPRYLKGPHIHETILMDRLYHAGSKPPGSKPPPFPFEKVVVSAARVGGGGAAGAATAASGGARSSSGAGATGPAAAATAAAAAGASALPAGWVQMSDPSTRRPYYVNQATGASQWEPPAAPKPQPQPAPVSHHAAAAAYPGARGPTPGYPQAQPQAAAPSPYGQQPAVQAGGYYQQQQQQPQQQIHQQQPQYGGQPQIQHHQQQQQQQQQQYGYQQAAPAAAGMYGAQPAAAGGYGQAGPSAAPYGQQQQYQQQPQQPQVQTQQAFSPAAGAGFGGGFGAPKPAAAPMSAPAPTPAPAPAPKPAAPVGPPPECIQQLGQLIDSITAICSPPEKRQMQMVSAAHAHLLEKWAAGEVGADVLQKLAQLVADLAQRNFVGASAMQTDLANTAWGQHKEWIKGLKVLIQLASKK